MKAKYWYIARGNISSKECLDDIMNNFKVDNYETKVSFVKIGKDFNTVKEARDFDEKFIKWCWKSAGAWHKESDMTCAGILKFEGDEWVNVADEKI